MSYGSVFGVQDVDRCGLFAEMSYLHGKGYTPPINDIRIRDLKKAQMNPGVPKVKTGLQDCYFDKSFFKRAFEREGWTTTFQRDLRERMAAKEKNVTKLPFIPSNYTKKPSCPGAFEGTFFEGPVKAFSPLKRDVPPKQKIPGNMLTNPAKKGGPGYVDICFSPYPKQMGGFYDDPFVGAKDPKRHKERILGFLGGGAPSYFDQNPWATKDTKTPTYKRIFDSRETKFGPFMPSSYARKKGDRYYGGLSEYPDSMDPRIRDEKNLPPTKEKKMAFYPQTRNRSFYTKSIVNRKIDITVNSNNWRTMQPVTFTREII